MAAGKLPDSTDDVGEDGNESIFAEINITPLTDVFLVMVIIFMVSALAVQVEREQEKKQEAKQEEQDEESKRSGIKINLPAGQARELDTAKASLILEIPLSGDVVVANRTIPDTALDGLFQGAFRNDKQTQVILKADKGVHHGRVVNLMERAKQAGLSRLAIGTAGGK